MYLCINHYRGGHLSPINTTTNHTLTQTSQTHQFTVVHTYRRTPHTHTNFTNSPVYSGPYVQTYATHSHKLYKLTSLQWSIRTDVRHTLTHTLQTHQLTVVHTYRRTPHTHAHFTNSPVYSGPYVQTYATHTNFTNSPVYRGPYVQTYATHSHKLYKLTSLQWSIRTDVRHTLTHTSQTHQFTEAHWLIKSTLKFRGTTHKIS